MNGATASPFVLVGATVGPYEGPELRSWLENAPQVIGAAMAHCIGVRYLCAREVDPTGLDPFSQLELLQDLAELDVPNLRFMVDDGSRVVSSIGRLRRICIGRNLIIEAALRDPSVTHVLFLDADISVPDDIVPRLVSLHHPVVGGHVPTYCLDGPRVFRDRNVREHWNTAGCLLVRREVIAKVQWGHSIGAPDGVTDDPWYQDRVRDIFGTETWVDHDVVCRHHPEVIMPLERRGYDLRYER